MKQNGWPNSIPPYKQDPPAHSVGIVMCMRDNLKFFKLAFHSLLSFTDYPYMLAVVDNMSTFTTKTYLKSIAKNHPIHVLTYNDDYNLAKQWNLGFAKLFENTQVQYGATVFSDVVLEPSWLSNMLTAINSGPDVGLVGPTTNNGSIAQQIQIFKDYRSTETLGGFCLMFKRSIYDKLNGFDDSYRGGAFVAEDFCKRASGEGVRLLVDGHTHVHRYRHIREHNPIPTGILDSNEKLFQKKFAAQEASLTGGLK